MLFWLKKAATVPFLPLYFALLSGLIGVALLSRPRWLRLGRGLVTVSVAALLCFSNTGVAILLLGPLQEHYRPIPEVHSAAELPAEVQACQAIVVLGGGQGAGPSLSRVNQLSEASLSRVAEAVRLARLLPQARVITSGNNPPPGPTHAQVLAEAMISLGVAPDRISRMDAPRDTEDEANNLVPRLGQAPFLLVTSAWHMPRAMELCRHVGLHPVACPADFMLKPGVDHGWALLSWDLGALQRSTAAIHERLGLLWNRLRGRSD